MIFEILGRALRAGKQELAKERAYLLPLRLFIGLGWIRAAVSKIVDRGWYDGTELTAFIDAQRAWSQEAFPSYGMLMESVLRPNAAAVGVVVILLQLAAGITITAGFYTNAGLMIAVALNVNFILAGVPDPSAFYIVIQLVLFYGGAGTVLGMDGRRTRRHHHPLLVASIDPELEHRGTLGLRVYATLSAVYLTLAIAMTPYVSSLDPATVVEDPALILVTLALFASSAAAIRSIGLVHRIGIGSPDRPPESPTADRVVDV